MGRSVASRFSYFLWGLYLIAMWKVKDGWFCVTDFCHVPPNEPGFYAIYLQNLETFKSELVYIGTAKDLKKRIESHEIIRILGLLYEYPIHINVKCKVFKSKLPHRRSNGWHNKNSQLDNVKLKFVPFLIRCRFENFLWIQPKHISTLRPAAVHFSSRMIKQKRIFFLSA